MYTLDTNVIIYYLKGDAQAALLNDLFAQPASLYISAITEAELFSFSNLDEEEAAAIEQALQLLSIIPVDTKIARMAAELRREQHIPLADALIAATALFTGSILVTRNVDDFRRIARLRLQSI